MFAVLVLIYQWVHFALWLPSDKLVWFKSWRIIKDCMHRLAQIGTALHAAMVGGGGGGAGAVPKAEALCPWLK
jgi:hypothetical protein